MSLPDRDADLERQLAAHAAGVRSLAAALVRDAAAADDIAQDALLAAWQRPPRRRAALGGYLARTVRRLAWRWQRGARRRDQREGAAAKAEGAPAAGDLAVRAEAMRALSATVAALPPALREVLLLRHYDGLPPREIAARLGLSGDAVESRLRRARAQIAAALRRQHGGGVPALLLLLREPVAPLPPGAMVTASTMTTKTKSLSLSAFALLLVAGAVAWWATTGGAPSAPAEAPAHAARTALASVGPGAASTAAPVQDRVAASPIPVELPASEAVRTVAVRGRIVDRWRRPAADATVVAQTAAGMRVAGRTASDGCFELRLAADGRGACAGEVLACAASTDGAAAAVAAVFWTPPGAVEHDVGTIALQPAANVRVRVHRGGAAIAGALVVARQVQVCAGVRFEAHTDGDGLVELGPMPAARLCVGVAVAGVLAAVGVVDACELRTAELVVDLADAADRELSCAVTAGDDGEPVAGAEVLSWATWRVEGGSGVQVPLHELLPLARTDANGRALLRGMPASTPLHVGARHPDWRPVDRAAAVAVAAGAAAVAVRLVHRGPARFRLVADSAPLPPDGTVFAIGTLPDAAVAQVPLRDGVLALPDDLPFAGPAMRVPWLRAWGPGCAAELPLPSPIGGVVEIALQATRRVEVVLRNGAGAPLPAVEVALGSAPWVTEYARTDRTGAVVFAGRVGRVTASLSSGGVLGDADLRAGDARIEVQMFGPRRVRARAFVDGVPALPGELTLRADGGHVTDVDEDPELGAVAFSFWPRRDGGGGEVHLYAGWRQSIGVATVPPGTGPVELEFRLERHGAATLYVVPPADGVIRLHVERVTGDAPHQRSIWTHLPEGPANDLPRLTNLRPGRYRLRDDASDAVGPVVEVVADGGDAVMSIDLSRVVPVEGAVVGDCDGVAVEVRDADGRVRCRRPVGAAGAFSLRVEVDRAGLHLVAVRGRRSSPPLPVVCAMQGVQVVAP